VTFRLGSPYAILWYSSTLSFLQSNEALASIARGLAMAL